ncbi:hypothetical protein CGC49_10750 [Capnocytophaga sp. H4358]|uniref:6-bladed beta-propeller n=1 Tax=Capnocytophaga sp. H4358 TaxID=1945658 RepID=UPI000BB1C217|nr:6-bladed beta-propeller [Capnocytophaga sp. H4358]ATA73706.1 hypothetical protein CGC49_10750 [Capnocytophaga sp. H4358]
MKKNIFILFCLVFFSCQQSKKGTVVVWNNEGAETFVIDAVNKKSNQTTNLNDYIESCRVVPLETRKDALVNKIEKVIVANNKVYLHCDRDKILIFEADTGKFINKIHAVGQGPEEYTEITDFAIEKRTNNICTYDERKHKVIKYTADGRFINAVRTKFHGLNIYSVNDSIYAVYDDINILTSEKSDLLLVNNDFSKLEELYFPHQERFYNRAPEKSNYSKHHYFNTYDDRTYITPSIYHYTYEIIGTKLKPKYNFDFGDKNIEPTDDIFFTEDLVDSGKVFGVNYYENSRTLFVEYGLNMTRHFLYIDKETKNQVFMLGKDWKNMPLLYYIFTGKIVRAVNEDEDTFMTLTWFGEDDFIKNNEHFLNATDSLYLPEIDKLRKVKSDDNPVLIFFRMKKF